MLSPQLASLIVRWVCLACSLLLLTSHARADPELARPAPMLSPLALQLQLPTLLTLPQSDPNVVWRDIEPARSNYLRASLEVVGLLGLGLTHYFANHDANSGDWQFGYDWPSFRKKISGTGYSFDTNRYDTNFITHPGSGTLYYWAARSNRLTVLESFAYSALASALWEFLGEFRESVSMNDVFVTPIAGLVLGETTFQLGSFFDRSCATPANRWLGSVLGPAKSLHDAIDGRHPLRDSVCDRYGLSLRGAHAFELWLEAGARFDMQRSNTGTQAQSRIGLHTRIVALDTYGTEGHSFTAFADGNVSELWIQGGVSLHDWTDFTIRATLVPIGWHYRSLTGAGARLFGSETLFGLLIGTEYTVHRFGWDLSEQADRLFSLDVPGIDLVYRRHAGSLRVELELQASVNLAASDALALPEYLRSHSGQELTSVARTHSYNYAAGFKLRPRARVIWHWFEAGVDCAATQLWVITALDRYPERMSKIPVEEVRQSMDAWTRISPRDWTLGFRVTGSALRRWGSIANTRASRTELQLGAGVDAVF